MDFSKFKDHLTDEQNHFCNDEVNCKMVDYSVCVNMFLGIRLCLFIVLYENNHFVFNTLLF